MKASFRLLLVMVCLVMGIFSHSAGVQGQSTQSTPGGATGQTVNPMISNPTILNPEFSPVFPSSPGTPPASPKPEGTKATDEDKSLPSGSKTDDSGKQHIPMGGETK
jgi:hypothetical protein